MNPLTIGKNYHLRLPDGRVLGQVRVEHLEDEWAEGSFRPAAAFPEFQSLFEKEARLRNDQVIPLWEEVADRLESLQIEVVGEDGDVHSRLRVFIEGDEAFLAPPLAAAP